MPTGTEVEFDGHPPPAPMAWPRLHVKHIYAFDTGDEGALRKVLMSVASWQGIPERILQASPLCLPLGYDGRRISAD